MKLCSGRWRVALGLGAALAVVAGFTPFVRAADGPRPLFPWRKPPAVKSIPQAMPKGDFVVLPEALTLAEEDSPLSDVTQTDPPKPPASSTGQPSQVPSPPPPLNRSAPTTTPAPAAPAPGIPTDTLTPVPNTIGEVLGGPMYYGEPAPGDPYPLQYRERPTGHRKAKAEIISHNRSTRTRVVQGMALPLLRLLSHAVAAVPRRLAPRPQHSASAVRPSVRPQAA